MMATERSEAGTVLTDIILTVFRLNGDFLQAAEGIAEPAGITAARWQVLGAILEGPKSVAEIARHMGLARQSVQRLADILAGEGLAAYAANPLHKRAKLLRLTASGRAAIEKLAERQHVWANAISEGLSVAALRDCLSLLRAISARVETRLDDSALLPANGEKRTRSTP